MVSSRPIIWGMMLMLLPPIALAQTPLDTTAVEHDVEATVEDLEVESGDPTLLVERLASLAEDPLDINTASAEALAQIPAFGPALALHLVAWREENGPFGSLPEIRKVPGMTEIVFLHARPYLTIGVRRTVTSGVRFELIQRLTRRLDLGRGYDDDTTRTTYLGSPERLYTRFRARYLQKISLNLTMEKDPGEPFGWDPGVGSYGYDHISFHAALQDLGRLQTLIVGDFEANFGQGVTLWRSIAPGKGRQTVRPLARFSDGLRPYGSTEENRFFRGLAATLRLTPTLALSAFASRHALDATASEPDPAAFTSLSTSGLHRTPTERAKKDALVESLLGGNLINRVLVHLIDEDHTALQVDT